MNPSDELATRAGIVLLAAGLVLAAAWMIRRRTERRNLRAFLTNEPVAAPHAVGHRLVPILTSEPMLTALVTLATGLVVQVLVGQLLVTLCVAGVVAVVLETLRGRRARRRQAILATQFADSLAGFASAMAAGNSFGRGLQQVVEGAADPIRGEWEQVLAEVELGSTVSNAVAGMARRTGLREVEWLAHVLRLHERTGTPAAGLLKQIASIVRQNESLELEVTALTAEGRLAAYVVAALPVGLVLFIQATQPGYLDPLSTGVGLWVSVGMVLSILGGIAWIKHMVRQVEA